MKAFWAAVAKYAAKLVVYAAEHPDQVAAVIQAAQEVKQGAK